MPFDYVKTNFQKEKCEKIRSVLSFMRDSIKEKGFYLLYTGWQVKLVNYIVQSFFFVNLYYKLENEQKAKKI